MNILNSGLKKIIWTETEMEMRGKCVINTVTICNYCHKMVHVPWRLGSEVYKVF